MKVSLSQTILFSVLFIIDSFALEPRYAEKGMVAGPEPFAVQAGVDILQRGGNAYDAAVAIGFALAVTYPTAGNLGGGGFMISVDRDKNPTFLDFREMAPGAATHDMFLDPQGKIVEGLSTRSLLASGVPGTVHGLFEILDQFGSKSREEVLAFAIHLAEDGFPVSYSLHRSLTYNRDYLSRFPSSAKVFYPEGKVPAWGSIFKQPDLAWTLRQLSENGPSAFYEGAIANKITQFMQQNGGIITRDDLKAYSPKYRKPIIFDYKGYTVIGPGLPSSGGITLAQILKLIEPLPLRELGYHSADYVRTLVEAERLAFADRNHYLGDPDFVDVPVEQLLSASYLDQRRASIPAYSAGKSEGNMHGDPESHNTTHYCVVDRDRNTVAITYTLNDSYGMGAVVEGAGFLLNNEMDDFSAKPGTANLFGLVQGEANAIVPGKRMLSSMTPIIALKDGQLAFTVGTPGGPTIITTDVQIILNLIEMNMNIRDAIDARRFHHQGFPDNIQYERFAFSPETLLQLVGRGYRLVETRQIGFASGIQVVEPGIYAGYSDGRGEGMALGY